MVINKFNKKINHLVKKYVILCFSFIIHRILFLQIKSKDEINRDLKLALTASNNDTQAIYNQLRQLNVNLSELQQKYDRDLAERDQQIELIHKEKQQLIVTMKDI